ncbi:MAG: ECF transporter S component [Butyricicoccus sp.]|nr:ECF transporter S component [Butyricicoccus sp.]
MKQTKRFSLYSIVAIGVMAAFIFVATKLLSIPIMTPSGKVMLKTANALCLLFGTLFGGVPAGLAAGIGSGLFDLTDPVYAPTAWLTFIKFFLMAFLCGKIAYARGARGTNHKQNIAGAVCGALFLYVFFIIERIVTLMVGGSAFVPALIAVSPIFLTSGFNAVFSVVVSQIFAPVLLRALAATAFYQKLEA